MSRSSKKNVEQRIFPSRTARTASIEKALQAPGAVTIAGRVMSRDVHDGRLLLVVADASGSVTCICPTAAGVRVYDIVEVHGHMQGRRLVADGVRVLAAHTTRDGAAGQWVQLMRDPKKRDLLVRRSQAIAAIRAFFAKRGFLECDTPALVAAPGMEPYLTPFETQLVDATGKKYPAYLVTSPEYALKKLLVAGFEKVFDLARVYRNGEEFGKTHNPEFTMLEWYRAYASYLEIMDDVEGLLAHLAKSLSGSPKIRYRGKVIDLSGPWERLTVAEAFARYAAVDEKVLWDRAALFDVVRKKGYRPADKERYEDLFFRIFLNEVEPCLGQRHPTILMDYPAELSAMAKRKEGDPRVVERFEVYVGGLELANGYTELNDPVEQRRRLVSEQALRRKLKKTVLPIDEDLLAALEAGMPPSGGVALGVDRLVMLMTDAADIDEVRFLPASTLFRRSGI